MKHLWLEISTPEWLSDSVHFQEPAPWASTPKQHTNSGDPWMNLTVLRQLQCMLGKTGVWEWIKISLLENLHLSLRNDDNKEFTSVIFITLKRLHDLPTLMHPFLSFFFLRQGLVIQPRLALNSRSSCLWLPSARGWASRGKNFWLRGKVSKKSKVSYHMKGKRSNFLKHCNDSKQVLQTLEDWGDWVFPAPKS
jgi:hypothetical protein